MNMQTESQKGLQEVYAFLGNSLLSPMTQTSDVGIFAEFWEDFPEFENEHFAAGRDKLIAYANKAAEIGQQKAIEQCAVEYTKLFIGPPTPAAPPWETMNKEGSATVGFGQATFEMKQLLRDIGFGVVNDNNQYEDHLGIELLYLSVLCDKGKNEDIKAFITSHPLAWIEEFRKKIDATFPQGYFSGLTELTQGVLKWHLENLD